MATAILTAKGQVTIPAIVRSAPGQFTIIAVTGSVRALKGILRKPPHPVSLQDMEDAIASEGGKFDDRP